MPHITATAIIVNKPGTYTSEIEINQHSMIADERLEKGGEDLGPAPGDYLCAALASCKAITLRMYAQRKQWEPGEIKVVVKLVLAKEMPMAKNTFFCEIYFTGDLHVEQKKRLLTIADSCPLHRMLSHPSDIVTTILS